MKGVDFNLVHSPLVGPSTWRRVEESLRLRSLTTWRGHVSLEYLFSPDEDYGPEETPTGQPGALVVHSAAGLFAPTFAQRSEMNRVIFVDAVLPAPGLSWLTTAPAPLAAHLTLLATNGVLPPWPTWFGASTMARLLPDEQVRAAFEAECLPIPLHFLWTSTAETQLPDGRHAYLRLSEGYSEEAERAQDLGWRVCHEPLHHLAMLTHPDRIAAIIAELAQEL